MARPLRIVIEDGWYHVINRGIERRSIFRSAADSRRFLQLLAQLPTRFGHLVHCYALMPSRIAHSGATRKLYNQLCATFKIDSAEKPRFLKVMIGRGR
jgi:hypothetical protein